MFIFDFDGVLIDSVDETALTAFNANNGYQLTELQQLPPGYLELFRANRPWPRTAAEMVILGKWCLKQAAAQAETQISTAQLEQLLQEDQLSEAELRRLFFDTRQKMIKEAPQVWLGLNRPYQPLWEWLKTEATGPLVILTHKNRSAVEQICHHFGLEVRSDRIYSGDTGDPKEVGLLAIMERFSAKKYHFVDDSIRNLLELKARMPADAEISLELASWGYCTVDDVKLAEKEGLRVLALCEISAYIKNSAS